MAAQRQSGFTLLEVVVAVAIFAVMYTIAASGLSSALKSREVVEAQAERLAEVQKGITILARDIEQAVNRPIRDAYADEQPAMSGGSIGSQVLEFTRGGLRNPANYHRSHLQRVGYTLQEGELWRLTWARVDRGLEAEPKYARLLTEVEGVELRFLGRDNQWLDNWPPPPPSNPEDKQEALPRAVEINIQLKDWGTIRRLLRVATS